MPKSKGRGTKNNPKKRAQNYFSETRLWSWESEREPGEQDVRTAYAQIRVCKTWLDLRQDIAESVVARRNNWMICARALVRYPDGKINVETEELAARDITVAEVQDHYLQMRESVLSSAGNRNFVVFDVGWIIQTYSKTHKLDEGLDGNLDGRKLWYLHDVGTASEARRQLWITYDKKFTQEIIK